MKFEAVDAKREKIWVKVDLIAPSGGGKTYSALRVATGMKEELKSLGIETKILMGNTEGPRGRYYANEFEYKIVDIPTDAEPEDYVDFIDYAVKEGYKILILDSTSHEWKKALQIHQQNGGDFKAFAKVTPRHNKLVAAIQNSEIHIVATTRGEDKYEVEKNEQGKTNVKKLGVGGDQRKDFEYEFTLTFLIDQKTNFAETQKDNTHLFENRGGVLLSEEDGKALIKWANSGEGYTPPVQTKEDKEFSIIELQTTLFNKIVELGGSKNTIMMEGLKSIEKSCNPKKVKNLETLNKISQFLNTVEPFIPEKENV